MCFERVANGSEVVSSPIETSSAITERAEPHTQFTQTNPAFSSRMRARVFRFLQPEVMAVVFELPVAATPEDARVHFSKLSMQNVVPVGQN